MRSPFPAAVVVTGAALFTLAACTGQPGASRGTAPLARTAALPDAGGVIRSGHSFATMAEQYTPRAGPFVATGASAWVPPAPPPAFVAAGAPPPADPPAPDPIEAAVSRAAAPAASAAAVRPEAAAPGAPAAPARDPALRTAGLALFGNYSCGTCHVFADADASGAIGPSLDNNSRLTRAFAIDVITNGSGAMPSFGGQMSAAEIATLADYLVAFARK